MDQDNKKNADMLLTKETAGKLLHIFLNMGEKLMGCGAEVKRVEERELHRQEESWAREERILQGWSV